MLLRNFVLHSYGCGRLCLLLEFDGATCAIFLPPSLAFPTMVKILKVRDRSSGVRKIAPESNALRIHDSSMACLEFVRLHRSVLP